MLTFSFFPFSTFAPYLVSFIILLLFLEQISYLLKKRHTPGPALVLPFIGNAISLVRDPTKFWDQQAALSCAIGFSANYIMGRFIVFIRDSELSHQIFTNVRPDAFKLIAHPFGKKLFGEHNLIYMLGQEHKDIRRRIAPNFTPKAVATYSKLQQIIILDHLKKWDNMARQNPDEPISLRLLARDLNLETSQTVMVGPYLDSEARRRFTFDYNLFNLGLIKLPVDLPGFAFREARLALNRLVATLAGCANKSKARMAKNEEPSSLVDCWMQETLREIAAGEMAPSLTSDEEIGGYFFDFLFAAQDASTSSILWAVVLLESHPEVLAKVRAEVLNFWSPESDTLITADQIREMKYTQAVAREVIRYRPPPAMVPHLAMADFPLTESYTIPKGTVVFPSPFESSFQGFKEPDRFDPDRFSEGCQEDKVFKKNFLAFGAGPHQCVGQRYALNHLTLFIALFSTLLDFKRFKTDGCDDIVHIPTTSPKDGCAVFLWKRYAKFPNLARNDRNVLVPRVG